MLLQISTLKFWINLESSDYFHLIGTARGGRSPRQSKQPLWERFDHHWALMLRIFWFQLGRIRIEMQTIGIAMN